MRNEGEDRQKLEERSGQAARFNIGDDVLVAAGFPTGTAGVIVRLPEKDTRWRYVVDLGGRHVQCAEQDLQPLRQKHDRGF